MTLEERLAEGWSTTDDLLAMLIEVTSVGASGRQLKKPIEVPRPDRAKDKAQAKAEKAGVRREDAAYQRAIGVLAASSKRVRG